MSKAEGDITIYAVESYDREDGEWSTYDRFITEQLAKDFVVYLTTRWSFIPEWLRVTPMVVHGQFKRVPCPSE